MAPPKAVRKKRPGKLASGTTARSVEEWVGKTPDSKAPPNVQLRIFARQGGKCALTGHKFADGEDARRLDHKVPLADGGENRESNLQWIWSNEHKLKTAKEADERAKVRARQKSAAGIKDPPKKPLQSRNDLAKAEKTQKIERTSMDHLPSNLARRYGIR